MATADVIVLSSSPPRSVIATTPPQGLVAMLSSSPGLPSPSMLMRTKRPSLVSASRAAQIPERAVAGFASAASLIKAGSPGLDPDARSGVRTTKGYGSLGPADKSGLDGGEKAKTKPKKRAPAGVEGAVAPKKSRAPSKKTKKDANTDGEVGQGPIHEEFRLPVKEKKPRKPRVRKDKDETQPKIKKGKITKPGTNDGIEKTAITKRSAAVITVSAIPDSGTNDLHVVSPPTAEQDLGLDEAVRRRKSWTPPKDTSRMTEPFNRGPGSTVESMDAAQGCPFEQPAKSFGNLCSSFGYDQPAESNFAPQVQRNIDGVALTKRRRIELDNAIPGPPAAIPAKRSKSPKKKPLTITEKATAKYAPEDPTPTAPILQYFALQEPAASGDSQGINKDSVTQVDVPTRPARRRSSVKSTAAKRKSKKGPVALPILLSPESALKKVKDQDVLFGTSSQLVGDESPTFLRDLQQAMKVSEAMPDQDSFVDSGYGDETPRPGSAKGLGTARYLSSGDLWSRAARDFEGSLLDAEVVDLAKSSPASQVHKDTKSKGEAAKERLGHFDLATASDQGGSWMVLDDLPNAEPLIAARENPRQEQEATDVDERRFMAKSIAEASLRKRPRSKSPVKKATKANGKTTTVRSSKIIQKPNFEGYPTTQLASELASYGFKPVNSRDQMIALLERCWEGKNRVALQSLGTNANLSTSGSTVSTTVTEAECSPQKRSTKASPTKKSKPASLTKLPRLGKPADEAEPAPKKPRGRPPKNTVSSTATKQPPNEARSKTATSSTGPHTPDKTRRKPTAITVEEIDDSDTPPTPSPPRRRSSPTTPRPLDVTSPTAEQTPNLTPTAAQKHLFFKITKAITTFPPTTDPKHPTWHEKILMYDPIVLEDLAAWLNTEGLGRVGVDEEVGTAVVRAWCEEKSVCCLWKENLWGGVRARY